MLGAQDALRRDSASTRISGAWQCGMATSSRASLDMERVDAEESPVS
jgi:hypothetical protein